MSTPEERPTLPLEHSGIVTSGNGKGHIPPEVIPASKFHLAQKVKKSKIHCRAWALVGEENQRFKLIGETTISYGKKYFDLGRGEEKLRYYINYKELKEGAKSFEYDHNADDATEALTFHKTNTGKHTYPNQADLMTVDSTVKLFKRKGGIPMMVVIALGIAIAVMSIISGLMATLYTGASGQVERLTISNTQLKIDNDELRQLNHELTLKAQGPLGDDIVVD